MHALTIGTLAFILMGAIAFLGVSAYLRKVSLPSRIGMNTRIAASSVVIGAVCMWIMWICTYMHQMNPLIKPDYRS